MITRFAFTSLLVLSAAVPMPGSAASMEFVGSDPNWFDPGNWSGGQVPGPGDDVVLDGRDFVVIDPALGHAHVQIRDLIVRGRAKLTTLPGTVLELGDEILEDAGQVDYRASAVLGERLIAVPDPEWSAAGFGGHGLKLNPTPKSKRDVILKSSMHTSIGLGGVTPASLAFDAAGQPQLSAGPGHHATLDTEVVLLAGSLRLSLHYGFEPAPGDRFTIITASRRSLGHFAGLPEGGLVGCTDAGIGIYISYVGGNGQDVVLNARATSGPACLLVPAIQTIRDR